MMRMPLRLLCCLLITLSALAQQAPEAPRGGAPARDVDIATRTNGLKRADGFAPYYWDAKKGMLLFELSPAREVEPGRRPNGLTGPDAFAPYYGDAKKGMLLFELSPAALQGEFLYFTALGSGVGSLDMFADRSSTHGASVCRFLRVGARV